MSRVNESFELTNQVWAEFQHPENTTVQKVTYAFGLIIAALMDSVAYVFNSFCSAPEVEIHSDEPKTLWKTAESLPQDPLSPQQMYKFLLQGN
jgi:hypothetical protein